MKNAIKVLGFIALVVIIGFSFSACDSLFSKDDSTKDNSAKGDNTLEITISGTPKVGEKLTAKSTGKFESGYEWWVASSPSPEEAAWTIIWQRDYLSGTDDCEFNLLDESNYYYNAALFLGFYIRASRFAQGSVEEYGGNGMYRFYSNYVGPIQPAD